MATFNTSSSNSTSSVSSVVEFLIPGTSIKKTEKNAAFVEKKEAEVASRRTKLANFFSSNSINPLPQWGKTLVTIGGKIKLARMPKAFYDAMSTTGVEWFGGREKSEKGVTSVKGCKLVLASIYKTIPSEEGMEFQTVLKGSDIPKAFALHLANELSKLSPEQYAELISIFCVKAEVIGSVVSIVGSNGEESATTKLLIDLKTKEVKGRSNRKAHEIVEIAGEQFDSKFALLVLAIQICSQTSTSRINSTLVELPNLWERQDTYGATMKSTDPTRVALDSLVLPMGFVGAKRGAFPFLKIENDTFNCSSLANVTGPVAVDKYAKQWMTLGKGAQAMMLGRNGDIILNPHDGGKAAKEYNRPTQGMKFLKADSPVRNQSNLRIQLDDGSFAIAEGTFLMTAFTNSRLGAGSGVSFIKPGTKIHYQVEKTLTGQVTTLRVPSEIRAKMSNLPGGLFTNLKNAVELQCQQLIGKVFAPNQVVLGLFGGRYEVIRNNNHNQDLKVVAVEIIDLNAIKGRADSFQVKLTVVLDEKDDCLKLRNMGIKLTTLPYPVKGLRDDWQLILNNETAKGKLGLVHLFANKYGATYYPNEGMLLLDNPCEIKEGNFDKQVIDLKVSENAFTQWVKENTETTYIQIPIFKTEWEVIKACHLNADDVTVVSEHSTYVVVEEKIQVVYGLLPYEVEISTPRENTGTGALTLEQLAAISLQNKDLAEKIWEESQEYQQTVKDLVSTVLKTDVADATQLVITTKAGRETLRDCLSGEFANDREVMKAMEKAFPKGLVLSAVYNDEDKFLYIKPSVISRMGAFFGNSASGIVLDVLSFLNYLLDSGMEKESGIDQVMYSWTEKLSTSLDAWLESMSKSGGVLKKLGRTGPCLVNLKIKSSYHPELEPGVDGLPVAILHPNCASVKLLGIKDGDIIGVGRTPMVFLGMFKVKLSQIGRVGHLMVGPYVWSATTEGDSDGDGVFTLNATKRGVNLNIAKEMNLHTFGIAGYSLVYGSNYASQPYAEFCSFSDKWGKKAVNKTGVMTRQIPFSDYKTGAKLVSDHYSFAVGISYGICSVLTFYTANLKYANVDKELVRVAELATVVAWRKLYEGLGLSGYSVKAAEFFEILRAASFSKDHTYIKKDGKIDFSSNAKGEEILQAIPRLIELAEIVHMPDAQAIMKSIIAANQTRMGYSRLENGKKVNENMTNRAALFGALRRMGQGKYGIDPMDEFSQESQMSMDDELKPNSTYSVVKARELQNQLQCPFLKDALTSGVEIHFTLNKKWVEDAEAEDFGM